MEINTPILQNRINELNRMVQPYTDEGRVEKGSILPSVSIKKIVTHIYFIVPLIVFIILLFWRPSIICNDFLIDNVKTLKLSWKKLLVVWMIISFILLAGIYGFYYKKVI
jgi:hypothetical protein